MAIPDMYVSTGLGWWFNNSKQEKVLSQDLIMHRMLQKQ